MKRLLLLALVALAAVLPERVSQAQPVVIGWRPPAGCSTDDVIAWNGSAWVCATGGGFITAVSSDFSVTGTTLDLSPAVTAPGALSVAGVLTALGQVDIPGAETSSFLNYSTNQDIYLRAGKTVGSIIIGDANTGAVYIGAAANATFIDGSASVTGTATVTGLLTATAGGTTSANWTTTGTGDLVSGDDLTVADDATVSGDSILGSTTSNTTLVNGTASVVAGTTTAIAALAGTTLTLTQADGTANYLVMRGNQQAAIYFYRPSSSNTGGIVYGSTLANSLTFIANNVGRARILSTGTLDIGDISGSTIVDNNVDVVHLGNTGTGQTSGKALINASNTGTYNTTSGILTTVGLDSAMSATESTGGNLLYVFGVRGVATGDDANTYNVGVYGRAESTLSSGVGVYAQASDALQALRVDGTGQSWFTESLIVTRGTKPALSSCGTSPTMDRGTAQAGTFTTGTGATACTVSFDLDFGSSPSCVVSRRAGGTAPAYSTNFNALTLSTAAASATYDYVCFETAVASIGGIESL